MEYELVRTSMELLNVGMTIPFPPGCSQPKVTCEVGEATYSARNNALVWTIPMINQGNSSGTLEFTVTGARLARRGDRSRWTAGSPQLLPLRSPLLKIGLSQRRGSRPCRVACAPPPLLSRVLPASTAPAAQPATRRRPRRRRGRPALPDLSRLHLVQDVLRGPDRRGAQPREQRAGLVRVGDDARGRVVHHCLSLSARARLPVLRRPVRAWCGPAGRQAADRLAVGVEASRVEGWRRRLPAADNRCSRVPSIAQSPPPGSKAFCRLRVT